jgi:protein arginine N-methyltransferase 1
MLRDTVRVMAYRAAIFAHARDQVVLDLGCGTGILSVFAAQAGARKVYAVEKGGVAGVARLLARANGAGDRVEVLRGDARELTLPERATLVVHELFGPDPLAEGCRALLDDARRRHTAPGARFLPRTLAVACVGVEPPSLPTLSDRLQRETDALGRLYGLDLSAYALVLEANVEAIALSGEHGGVQEAPQVITREAVLMRFDLGAAPEAVAVDVPLEASVAGRVGGLLVYFTAELDESLVLSTSPFAPRTHWGWSLRDLPRALDVKAGERLTVRARIDTIDGNERVIADVV